MHSLTLALNKQTFDQVLRQKQNKVLGKPNVNNETIYNENKSTKHSKNYEWNFQHIVLE